MYSSLYAVLVWSHYSLYMYTTEELEGNIDENKRSAELLELQETLSWPTVSQLDTDSYIPEVRACTWDFLYNHYFYRTLICIYV